MDQPRRRGPMSLAPSRHGDQQPTCRCAEASGSVQASGVLLYRASKSPSLTGAALAQNVESKCSLRNGRSIVDQRLRRRALLGGVMASLGLVSYLAAVQIESVRWRDAAIYVVPPSCYLVMACITPAATPEDIRPAMEWCMRYASALSLACALCLWVKSAQTHPCGGLVSIPGLLGLLARASVPLLGLRNPMWFWPAERCVLVFYGMMRFLQVALQTHAVLLAEVTWRHSNPRQPNPNPSPDPDPNPSPDPEPNQVAAALGLSELLPVQMASQCQAHQTSSEP